jgi:hypothetical protein
MDHSRKCNCGKSSASFNFRDEILPFETIAELYCPSCSRDITYDPASMLNDNNWIIRYDMDIARFAMRKKSPDSPVTPEFIFDEGFCTWRGVYPGDHIDSANERNELLQLAKTDRKRYFEEFKTWGIRRMERLAQAGWRKANEREPVKA